MKPSRKRFREAVDEFHRQVNDARAPLYAVYAFKKDKRLRKWFDQNCKGLPAQDAPARIAEAVSKGELTDKQAAAITTTLTLAGMDVVPDG